MTVGTLDIKGVWRGSGEASFLLWSGFGSIVRQCAEDYCNGHDYLWGIGLSLISALFNITANWKLYAAQVVNSYGETASVSISARDQSMLKSNHRQIIQLLVREDVVQHAGLCNGWQKGLDVSSLCNIQLQIINKTTQNTNSAIAKIV